MLKLLLKLFGSFAFWESEKRENATELQKQSISFLDKKFVLFGNAFATEKT